MKIALKNVKANPFRHIERYPLRDKKTEALTASINDTDFWENIVARDMGDGTIQIAYGHHRLDVLNTIYSPDTEFDFIIADIDDAMMCKIMVNENMEEFGADSAVEQESIRAVVQGYADGFIDLGEVGEKAPNKSIRYAPSFIQGSSLLNSKTHPYTCSQIVDFTGWKEWKVQQILSSLESQEKLETSELTDIDGKQQDAITKELEKIASKTKRVASVAEKEGDDLAVKSIESTGKAALKRVEKHLHKGFVDGSISLKTAHEEAIMIAYPVGEDNVFPDINDVASKFALSLTRIVDEEHNIGKRIRELVKYRSKMADNVKASMYMSLCELADEANELAEKFKKGVAQ